MITIPDFSQARVVVAGDVMLDRYWYGSTSRISPEAPVPVVAVERFEDRLGGAANVALGLAVLGTRTALCGVVGDDENGQALTALLQNAGIADALSHSALNPTTTKLRVISHHQQMIRLDFEPPPGKRAPIEPHHLGQQLQDADAVVLSDYAKGALQSVQELIQVARAAGKPVLVDPKQEDFSVYRGATLITPNRREFEQAVGRCRDENDLVSKGMALLNEMQWEAILLTRSEEGMTLLRRDQEPLHIPAQAHEVFDVTGAGDTVIAVLAASLAVRMNLADAARLANLAAGIVVGKLGTASVSRSELEQAVNAPAHAGRRGLVPEAVLLTQLDGARKRGERIVMTWGVFDVLAPRHLALFERARMQGDRLVVAVADDDVARRIRATAPVNPLTHRLAMLAALAHVDWVVPLVESSPDRLLAAAKPDTWMPVDPAED